MKKTIYTGIRMPFSKAFAMALLVFSGFTAQSQLQPVYFSSFSSNPSSEVVAANPSCLLEATNANITNAVNTATASLTDFSSITTPLVGVTLACADGYRIRSNLNLQGLSSVGASSGIPYFAGFHIKVSSTALLTLLGGNNGQNLILRTYLNNTLVQSSTGVPIGLNLLTAGVEGNVYFQVTAPFNQVQIELSNSLLTLGAIESIQFYYAFASGRSEDVILPVKLTSFTATPTAKNVTVNWATASETNADKYELQRSSDGGATFSTIATIAAKGNTTAETAYTYTDGSAVSGSYTYRLKMTDKDGKAAYSQLATVKVAGSTKWKVYPTLLSSGTSLNVAVASAGNSKAQVQLANMQGQVVRSTSISSDTKTIVATNGLAAGVYVLRLYKDGQLQAAEKIVIQ